MPKNDLQTIIPTASDESLVARAKSGEAQAFCELTARYDRFFDMKAHGFLPVSHFEDFRSEALVAFFNAVKTFDPEKASFRTYLNICVTRALISFQRKLQIDDLVSVSLDDTDQAPVDLSDVEQDPQSRLEQQERRDLLHREMEEKLSDLERRALLGYLRGHSYETIAETLSTTEKSVDNALQRVRFKLKHSDLFR